jgi:hypothetical protein
MRTLRLCATLYAAYALFSLRLPEPLPPPALVPMPPDQWSPGLGTFRWGAGSVQFPPNFRFAGRTTTDTYSGTFTSPDGRLVVHLSAGYMAGTAATPYPGTLFFAQGFRQRSRIWMSTARVAKTALFVHHLSFPDAGCTNFSTYSANEGGREFLLELAGTFRPIGPLLPAHTCS